MTSENPCSGADRKLAGCDIEETVAASKNLNKDDAGASRLFATSSEKSSLLRYEASTKVNFYDNCSTYDNVFKKPDKEKVLADLLNADNFNNSKAKQVSKIMSPMAMAMQSDCFPEQSFQQSEMEIPSKIHYDVHVDNIKQSKLYNESTCSNFPVPKKKSTYKYTSNSKQRYSQLPLKNPKFMLSQQESELKYTSQANLNKSHMPSENLKSGLHFSENSAQDRNLEKRSNSQNKSSDLEKVTKKYSRQTKKHNSVDSEKNSTCSIKTLLTFRNVNIESENCSDLIKFSDDDDNGHSNVSQTSFGNSSDLIDFSSDSPVSQPINISNPRDTSSADNTFFNSLYTDEANSCSSEESDLNSEFSVQSSFIENESSTNISKLAVNKEDSFVSVFWDMENCALPSKKSAVDFANYVRGKFYEGRNEVAFIAACDVSNLSSTLIKELDEATITAVHTSSHNKNDKIMTLLKRFQTQYQKSNSAVVLISTDSYFSQILLDMRYQHHVFVNVICHCFAESYLTAAANNFVFFESILKELPDQDIDGNLEYVLVVTNASLIGFQQIKDCLPEILKNVNCRFKHDDVSKFKIIFQDNNVCKRTMKSLNGLFLNGHALTIKYQQEKHGISVVKKRKEVLKSVNRNENRVNTCKNVKPKSNVVSELNSKTATLCVVVNSNAGDIQYWKNEFKKIWKMNDFSISCESTFGGCFLVDFISLNQAQRAKKLLLKNQMKNPMAPKFIKLIKQNENSKKLTADFVDDIEERNLKKVEEHLQIIEKKKVQFLKKHENIMLEMKNKAMPETAGTAEALSAKLTECEEQMKTFRNFSNMIMDAVRHLNCQSEDFELKLKELLCDFTRECNCITSALPIYAKKEEILRKIEEHQVIVIRAETGSGKSTQLTQYIWRARNKFHNGAVICTQPRKIAAISLAKHVSMQIGSCLGDLVGYQVGMMSKMSTSTKILYVTDFTMLKILISGNLDGVSCIIVDEAHERTIYTDILLGMIKWYLPNYPHLKIIITSATIDTSIFRDYFSLTDNAVLNISGRTFPIEDVWLNSDGDYFNKAIDKALEILSEEPGDVLSFLTTPIETEKAMENFSIRLRGTKNERNVKVFCLHGKMNAEEQQKVFAAAPRGVRKVIFSTNCAETSITIPGIKYVIDCGLVKESKYDSSRNMNVLSVGFVSKSSAEQRRGRAGRTQVGKCYRLYSKKDYNCMADSTDPEILRINLGQALLKLLKMGVENPLKFDFIQSPPKEMLNAAMDQLLYLNAVDEKHVLTDLGKNMAVLPLEPRLCHLIFQGFDHDIGYDALVISALITMSHAIFFRNSENKDEADAMKRRFCESESDFLSYLTVYKEWSEVPKNSKSQWCTINCINARSMRTVHELVNEIILTLQRELNLTIKQKFSSESTYETLTRTIFYSFSQNLAVFSGHPRFGYRCLNVPDQLFIHPSSSLSVFGKSTPEFVVYDTILKTTQAYIVNVCPVARDMIINVVNTYNLKIDLNALSRFIGSEVCIKPVGEKILFSDFIGKKGIKRKEIQTKIKEITNSEFIEIDIDVPKGCIKIFGFDFNVSDVQSLVFTILRDAKEKLYKEEKDVCLSETGPLTAILGAGGVIVDVILPEEFRDIKVILKGLESIDEVLEKISTCGTISTIREWRQYFKVTFRMPFSAKKALDTYSDEKEFSLSKIHRYSHVNEKDYLYKVFMSFLRRPCLGVAFVSTEPRVSHFSLPRFLSYNDKLLTLSISKKSGDIRIVGLPADTDKKKLEQLLLDSLPCDTAVTKCVVSRKKPYESLGHEIESIKKNIVQLFAEFTVKEHLTVNLKKPTVNDFNWNATVYFKNSHHGETAVNVLRNRSCITNFNEGLILKPELKTYLSCKSHIFSAVKEEIEEALQFFKNDQSAGSLLEIKADQKSSDLVEVMIRSNKVRDVTDAQRCIHKILMGDELKVNDSCKRKLFSQSGQEFIKKLSSKFENCYILCNDHNKTLTIFGKEASCNTIKIFINEFLSSTEDDDLREINLKTDSGKTGVLKALLKKYGYDLTKLKKDCDASDIIINKYKQILVVQGSSASISKCESIVQDIKGQLEENCLEIKGEVCPVCSDEVSEDKHRLQYCGHAYCIECLLHLFQYSEVIPLLCEVESCKEHIVLNDIFWAIDGRKSLKKALFIKFLNSFVASHDNIKFCPSPDCPMVFRITKDRMDIYKCSACRNSLCTKCGDLYHFGTTCGFNKCLQNSFDKTIQAWLKEDPQKHKICPSCSSPIEKNEGCNHMTCWKCKCHMCWLCLKVFPTSNEVYVHLRKCFQNVTVYHPLMPANDN